MPKDAKEKALQELRRIEMMPPMSAESSVSRNYLDWLIAVPWKKKSREIRDIDLAEKTLNEDHYGLEKIKDRILEFLSVRQLVKKAQRIDSLLRRTAGGRKDLARHVHRSRHGTKVCPARAWRRT
jgi:ATP-dependent Lon protease